MRIICMTTLPLWWHFSESLANVVLLFWSVGRSIICRLVIAVSETALGENESFDNRGDGRIRRHRDWLQRTVTTCNHFSIWAQQLTSQFSVSGPTSQIFMEQSAGLLFLIMEVKNIAVILKSKSFWNLDRINIVKWSMLGTDMLT